MLASQVFAISCSFASLVSHLLKTRIGCSPAHRIARTSEPVNHPFGRRKELRDLVEFIGGNCRSERKRELQMWSDQFKAAAARGLLIAVLTSLLTTLTTWSQTSGAKTLAIAGATSFISTFLARSGLEGMYDTN